MTRTREENAADLQQAATEHEKRERQLFMVAEAKARFNAALGQLSAQMWNEVQPTDEELQEAVNYYEDHKHEELVELLVATKGGEDGYMQKIYSVMDVLDYREMQADDEKDEERVKQHEANCDTCQSGGPDTVGWKAPSPNPDASPTLAIDQAIPLSEIRLVPEDVTTDEEVLMLFQLVSSKLQDIRALPTSIKDFVDQNALIKLQAKVKKAMIHRGMFED